MYSICRLEVPARKFSFIVYAYCVDLLNRVSIYFRVDIACIVRADDVLLKKFLIHSGLFCLG